VSAALAVGATLALVSLTGAGHDGVAFYKAPAYSIAKPAGWQALPQQDGGVALRRKDGKGLVIVRPTAAPADQKLSKLAAGLTAQLKSRFADFRPVSARVAPTRGGAAFLYTFARTRAGLVQSLMLTRVNGRSFAVDAIAPAREPAAARQVGAVLGTFGR
jgi:hypothetical protein